MADIRQDFEQAFLFLHKVEEERSKIVRSPIPRPLSASTSTSDMNTYVSLFHLIQLSKTSSPLSTHSLMSPLKAKSSTLKGKYLEDTTTLTRAEVANGSELMVMASQGLQQGLDYPSLVGTCQIGNCCSRLDP
ncbi:LRR repeats and ubiquitin-like domain-containing protein isoform X1 [Quillaja saponaria]|uniref:LRR repeats and ubiquitin-like domain-containing protein isoform X1 n=1 Tax=Quillaja saponaria TaxID=32244 RepID=A0AAD7PLD2_QUISA|nr:LRR repeats and ubiquitin-like domain-containing protein isoform X1 [Quillaja saponaria]